MVSELTLRLEQLRRAPRLELFLDYDAALVPLASQPCLAIPTAGLRELLLALALRPSTRVHVVSGQSREFVDGWFGRLPLALHAEHGFWSRPVPGHGWVRRSDEPWSAKRKVLAVFADLAASTPGSVLEPKTASVAWHYRHCAESLVRARIAEAHRRLETADEEAADVELREGLAVLEARKRGLHRSRVVTEATWRHSNAGLLVASGDVSNQELFYDLPPAAVAVHVGTNPSVTRHRVQNPEDLLRLLQGLLWC